jgi:site-specific DNA recombinase
MNRRALRGVVLGRIAYGYGPAGDGSLRTIPQEAAVVRRIFALASEGKGVRTIVKDLNAGGPQTRRGRPWSMITIRDMLRNRTYTGTYQRFTSRVTGNHEALVSPSEFALIQKQLDERAVKSGNAKGKPFLLSGLAICGTCGSHMIGVTRHRSWNRKDGTTGDRTYRYYQCEGATNQGRCSSHGHPAPALDAVVLTTLRTGSSTPGRIRRSVETALDRAGEDEKRMRTLQRTVRETVESVTVSQDVDVPATVTLKESNE